MKQRTLLAILIFVAAFALLIRLLKTETGFRLVVNLMAPADGRSVFPQDVLKMNHPHVYDVRTREEFAISHLPGAEWVGFENFSPELFSSVPRETPMVFYCTAGARSGTITDQFREAGYKNSFNLYGGIVLWRMRGNKIVNLEGEATTDIHPYNRFWNFWAR